MPQVRDPKTGRYTSGGGSSVGGAASTNPRIQKAKAVGSGATAGGASTTAEKLTADNARTKIFNAKTGDTITRKDNTGSSQSYQYHGGLSKWVGLDGNGKFMRQSNGVLSQTYSHNELSRIIGNALSGGFSGLKYSAEYKSNPMSVKDLNDFHK